jgi:hypothetical protein
MEIIQEIEGRDGITYSAQSPLVHKEEQAGRNRSGKAYDNVFLPCHYFDYIAGTSTGGFVVLICCIMEDFAKR